MDSFIKKALYVCLALLLVTGFVGLYLQIKNVFYIFLFLLIVVGYIGTYIVHRNLERKCLEDMEKEILEAEKQTKET